MNPMVFPPSNDGPKTARMCTPEEADLLHWLQAEREWHWGQHEAKRKEEARREEEVLHAQAVASFAALLTAHTASVESTTGLRRHLLTAHRPRFDRSYRGKAIVTCRTCYGGDYDVDFPCDIYVLARDWEDKS